MWESQSCEVCGVAMNLKRRGARTCSARCRQRLARRSVFPADMVGADRWMRWRLVVVDGRERKVPIRADGTGCASSTDPASWSSFREASRSRVGRGLGFALGAGIGCWDFDHCLTDGVLDEEVRVLVEAIRDPLFIEVSQSGEGLHVFVAVPEGPASVRPGVEFYARDRFIALTGKVWRG